MIEFLDGDVIAGGEASLVDDSEGSIADDQIVTEILGRGTKFGHGETE